MNRGPRGRARGVRFPVWLALSHGGPDRGFPVTTDRQTQAQNKGTKFCFDLQTNLTQPQSRGQHGDRRGCVIIMRSMTYWHDGGGPGGLLGTFPQFLGRHRELATPSYMATLFSLTQHQMTTRALLGPSSPFKRWSAWPLRALGILRLPAGRWALAARF